MGGLTIESKPGASGFSDAWPCKREPGALEYGEIGVYFGACTVRLRLVGRGELGPGDTSVGVGFEGGNSDWFKAGAAFCTVCSST
jgi:hypothetical protein